MCSFHPIDMDTFEDSDLQAVEREESACDCPQPKAKKGKATGKRTEVKKGPDACGKKKKKRGPPRPHRQVPDDVLATRLGKLQKRIDKAKTQLADATRHFDGYHNEKMYRESEEAEAE